MNPVSPVPGQLLVAAAALGLLCLLNVVIVLVIVIGHRVARRAGHRLAARRVLEELGLHLDDFLLQHPDVQEGFDRLQAAIGTEQRKDGTS